MADYNLRLLTTLQDTDYIQVNNSDGIQFGIYKNNIFPGGLQTLSALNSTPQNVKDNLGNISSLSLATQSGTNPSLVNYGTIIAGNGNGSNITSLGGGGGSYGAVGSNYYWKPGIGLVRTLADAPQKLQFNANNQFTFSGGATNGADTYITWIDYFGRNTNGYFLGVYGSTITQNGALTVLNHSTGNLVSLRNNANTEVGYFDFQGSYFTAGGINSGSVNITGGSVYFLNRCRIYGGSVDGNIQFTNTAASGAFGLMQLGGTTSANPAIKRSGTEIHIRLADDSAYANIDANVYKTGGVSGVSYSGPVTNITVTNGIITAIS